MYFCFHRIKMLCKWLILIIFILVYLIYYVNSSYSDDEKFGSKVGGFRSALDTDNIILSDTSGNLKAITSSEIQIPKGSIIMWSGATIPTGWVQCDGNQGIQINGINIPDLRGKFILGHNSSTSRDETLSPNSLNTFGGEETHKLTQEELPKVVLPYAIIKSSSGGVKNWDGAAPIQIYTNTTELGSEMSHNNMPPYYVLMYIIKVV